MKHAIQIPLMGKSFNFFFELRTDTMPLRLCFASIQNLRRCHVPSIASIRPHRTCSRFWDLNRKTYMHACGFGVQTIQTVCLHVVATQLRCRRMSGLRQVMTRCLQVFRTPSTCSLTRPKPSSSRPYTLALPYTIWIACNAPSINKPGGYY